jgi:hypothetical protein
MVTPQQEQCTQNLNRRTERHFGRQAQLLFQKSGSVSKASLHSLSKYDPVARLKELGFPALAQVLHLDNEATVRTRSEGTFVIYRAGGVCQLGGACRQAQDPDRRSHS